jgi:hypothetical protein
MNKRITFDRQTKDFRAEVDGILIGFYATHAEAQAACDAFVFDALTHGGA